MSPELEMIHGEVADALARLEGLFPGGRYKLTFVARHVEDTNANLAISNEADMLAAAGAIKQVVATHPTPSRAIVKCRVCGCTDLDCRQCIEKTGQPCSWVEPDLCSACVGASCGFYIKNATGAVDYLAKSLAVAFGELTQIRKTLDYATEDDVWKRVARAVEMLRGLDHHLMGTDIGLAQDFGAWLTKDGWEPASTHPLLQDDFSDEGSER